MVLPVVSVIIPTYNRGNLIKRALASVLNQTYQDFEVIIVDDASTDATEKIIKEFQGQKISYLKHERNRGAAAARNSGIRVAKGEFIAFQDSDDEWLPEKLEKMMRVFEELPLSVGVIYSGYYRFVADQKTYHPLDTVVKKDGDIHFNLLGGNYVSTQVAIVRKCCFSKTGMFDERLANLEDWELWLRISKYYEFKFIAEPLVNVYYQQDSLTAKSPLKALEIIIEKFSDEINADYTLSSNLYSYITGLALAEGDKKRACKYFKASINKSFFKKVYLLYMIGLMLPNCCYKRIYNQIKKRR